MIDEKGNFPGIERPMMVDAAACMFSALVGTSTSGAYIESATGIREGARTGLAAVTTAGLVLYPLFKLLTGRGRELKAGSVVLGLLCLVYYVFGLPH